jgi:hypothetical protein
MRQLRWEPAPQTVAQIEAAWPAVWGPRYPLPPARAARLAASGCLWRVGEADAAVARLEPYAPARLVFLAGAGGTDPAFWRLAAAELWARARAEGCAGLEVACDVEGPLGVPEGVPYGAAFLRQAGFSPRPGATLCAAAADEAGKRARWALDAGKVRGEEAGQGRRVYTLWTGERAVGRVVAQLQRPEGPLLATWLAAAAGPCALLGKVQIASGAAGQGEEELVLEAAIADLAARGVRSCLLVRAPAAWERSGRARPLLRLVRWRWG